VENRAWERVPIDAQSVEAPLSSAAVFLVLSVGEGGDALDRVREVLGAVGDLVKNVGFRDLGGRLSCIVGIGSALWDRLSPDRRPVDLRPFAAIQGPVHAAPSTPGDLLFHIRAERGDMTYELERQLLDLIGDAARVVDETIGFRYFDARDLLGFVDGTANPTGGELPDAALIGADADPEFAGCSYVVVQKYLHDMAAWARLSTEEQEAIIGRTKLDNVEIDDDDAPRKSHKSLATIEDDDGNELAILRDNMPFGRPGAGEFGTYFIGYAGRVWVIEQMLARMFVGVPAGSYDRLLDFSTAVTGTTFFVPTAAMLDTLADGG
jgi:putative iron-dependent peroxidase